MLASMRYICGALGLWIAYVPITQSTQDNDSASKTNSVATVLRLTDIQQCPVSPKPVCSDPTCQGSRFHCARQFLCSNESPFTDSSSSRLLILADCRCCPLPAYVECATIVCDAPAGTRVCAAEPLQGCTCRTSDDRVRAAQERTAGWLWPVEMNDDTYDVDIESSSGDEDEADNGTTRGVSSSLVPMATMPPLALLPNYHWAMNDQPDMKFLF